MIGTVDIKNFRALERVSVKLQPLTVLVGPNDSGKSSFLDAIDRATGRPLERDDWRRGGSEPAQVHLLDEQGSMFQGRVELFKLPSAGIPMESRGHADDSLRGAPSLRSNGEKLATFLDYLVRQDRKRFDQIQTTLQALVPGLEEVKIAAPASDSRAVEVTIENGFKISGERLSTGVRMLFFFVALAHHPNPPTVAMIEEPENGVHPKRLKDIMDLLRSLSEGKLSGNAVQVILTTHSPYVLDHVHLPQDQVLVFRREDNGDRTVTPADRNRLKTFLDEFMLGEVWFNQGEEGLLAVAR